MSALASVSDSQPLGKIRDYALLAELGRGAHGMVYRARASGTGEPVALKVIEDNSSLDRLLIEPQLLSKLQHRNIVGLRDYFLHGGKVVLVMEYVQGLDLETYLRQHGPFSTEEVRDFLAQMAGALAHAHEAGVVHSDLKPSNILVDCDGSAPRFVIVDFGVSRIATGVTVSRRLAGTYAFMAPEQLRGRGGMQSDLWALGAIAHMLLCNSAPFQGATRQEIRRQVLYTQPAIPAHLTGNDAPLERVIVHLLEKSIVDRTNSATILLTELTGDRVRDAREAGDVARGDAAGWEQQLRAEIAKRQRRIVGWTFAAFLPGLVVPGLLSLTATYLMYLGQLRKRTAFVAAGFGVLLLAIGVSMGISTLIKRVMSDDVVVIHNVLVFIFGLFLLPAASNFVRARRAERELSLLQVLRVADLAHSIDVLRAFVTSTPGDTNMRLRLVEALLAAQRADEAAVEAQLLLEIDPYNLGATLLLANAYLDLGLLDRCEQVCDWYLSVSPQCFEFEELRESSAQRRRAA